MRFRPQFGLLSLFTALTIVAIVFGAYTNRYLKQAAALRELANAGAVCFEFSDGSVANSQDVIEGRVPLFAHVTRVRFEDKSNVLSRLNDLPYVRRLSMRGLNFTDDDMRHVGEMTKLESLNLYGTDISDKGLARLSKLKNLKWLQLSNTDVTGAGFSSLDGFTQLHWIGLSDTPTDDRGLRELARFPVLDYLNIELTNVSDDGLREIAKSFGLKEVVVASIDISDAAVDVLRQSVPKVDCFITRDTPIKTDFRLSQPISDDPFD